MTSVVQAPHRRGMDPTTLDGLLFLRYTKDMWKAADMECVIRELKAEVDEERLRRRATPSASTSLSL